MGHGGPKDTVGQESRGLPGGSCGGTGTWTGATLARAGDKVCAWGPIAKVPCCALTLLTICMMPTALMMMTALFLSSTRDRRLLSSSMPPTWARSSSCVCMCTAVHGRLGARASQAAQHAQSQPDTSGQAVSWCLYFLGSGVWWLVLNNNSRHTKACTHTHPHICPRAILPGPCGHCAVLWRRAHLSLLQLVRL